MTDIVDRLREFSGPRYPEDICGKAAMGHAADTIEALRDDLTELTALKRDIANALRDLTTEATENIALRAQVAELQKDAARYRWLRWSLYSENLIVGEAVISMRCTGTCPSEQEMDAAVDAVMPTATPSPNTIAAPASTAPAGD